MNTRASRQLSSMLGVFATFSWSALMRSSTSTWVRVKPLAESTSLGAPWANITVTPPTAATPNTIQWLCLTPLWITAWWLCSRSTIFTAFYRAYLQGNSEYLGFDWVEFNIPSAELCFGLASYFFIKNMSSHYLFGCFSVGICRYRYLHSGEQRCEFFHGLQIAWFPVVQ